MPITGMHHSSSCLVSAGVSHYNILITPANSWANQVGVLPVPSYHIIERQLLQTPANSYKLLQTPANSCASMPRNRLAPLPCCNKDCRTRRHRLRQPEGPVNNVSPSIREQIAIIPDVCWWLRGLSPARSCISSSLMSIILSPLLLLLLLLLSSIRVIESIGLLYYRLGLRERLIGARESGRWLIVRQRAWTGGSFYSRWNR